MIWSDIGNEWITGDLNINLESKDPRKWMNSHKNGERLKGKDRLTTTTFSGCILVVFGGINLTPYNHNKTTMAFPYLPTIDGSEIPFPTTWDGAKTW